MRYTGIKTLIIPAAGAGTRLLPLTSVVPKEMLRLVDKPTLYYILKEAHLSDIKNIVLIINPWKKSVENYCSDKNGKSIIKEFPNLHFSFIHTDNLFGDGYAIYLARKQIKDDFFAVSMADLLSPPEQPFLKQLIDTHKEHVKPVISVEAVPKNNVDRYGIINPGISKKNLYKVVGIIEKPPIHKAPSSLAMTGKYILPKTIFSYLDNLIKKRKPHQEIRLSDALKNYANENELLALACKGKHFDIGNKPSLLRTELVFAMQDRNLGKDFRNFIKKVKTRSK